jgi:hypothetical protein
MSLTERQISAAAAQSAVRCMPLLDAAFSRPQLSVMARCCNATTVFTIPALVAQVAHRLLKVLKYIDFILGRCV